MKEYEVLARRNQQRANEILAELNLIEFFENYGCKCRLIGSLPMGLLVKHLDIDLHVYSSAITEEKSFGIISVLAKNPRIKEIRCVNGLHTDEHCISWHLIYEDADTRLWQVDIIHIEVGTRYYGYFEQMVERMREIMTNEQRDTILRLKYETPENESIHGVEYYQAVIEDGVRDLPDMRDWVKRNRKSDGCYWMPK